jgi:hypothetical protein
MCHAWPFCEPVPYTVRRYHPDGRTAWVRNYGYPVAPNAAPIDCAVGSDGRVFVLGPRVGQAGVGAWSLRCYSASGETLWLRDVALDLPWIDPFSYVEFREIERDAASNVYLIGIGGGGGFLASYTAGGAFRFAEWSQWIGEDLLRLGVTAGGTYDVLTLSEAIVTSTSDQGPITAIKINDLAVADASGGVWQAQGWNSQLFHGGSPFDFLTLHLRDGNNTGLSRRMYLVPDGPYLGPEEAAKRVCLDGASRATFTGNGFWPGGPLPPITGEPAINILPTIARFNSSLNLLWTAGYPPAIAAGPIACTYDGHRIAASFLNGRATTALGDFYVASVGLLNGAGQTVWSHLHARAREVDIGEDGTVATVHGPARPGWAIYQQSAHPLNSLREIEFMPTPAWPAI